MLIKAPPSGAGFPPSLQALKFSTLRVAVPCVTGACFGSSWLAKGYDERGETLKQAKSSEKTTCFTMKLQKSSGFFAPVDRDQGGPPERSQRVLRIRDPLTATDPFLSKDQWFTKMRW